MLSIRLKKLREAQKLTQQAMAEKIDVARTTYAMYEQGKREPDISTINKIATYFNVSTDYLLGLSDSPNHEHVVAGISQEDYANLSEYQKEVIDFFLNLDDLAFKDKPEDILAALEQFELYYKMYKEQQAKKQK